MLELLYFFLPAIIILGVAASVSDIREGKVKNRLILAALVYALIVNIAAVVLVMMQGTNIRYSYITESVTNIVFAAVGSFFLYRAGFWAPGDGKLFLAFSALIPISVYSNLYIPFFPTVLFLSNALVIAALAIFAGSCLKLLRLERKKLRELFQFRKILMSILITILSVFSFSWIINKVLQPLPLNSIYLTLISYSLSIVIAGMVQKVIRSKLVLYSGYLVLSAFYFMLFGITQSVLIILAFSTLFSVSKSLIIDLHEATNRDSIPVRNLKPYSRIVEPLIKNGKQLYPAGALLGKQDVTNIQRSFPAKKEIVIRENVGLAPFLFIAALITLAVQGEVITWIVHLVRT